MPADRPDHGFATRAIHAGQEADPATGATVVPIYATSTYTQEAPGKHKGYEYSRSGNPTRAALETCLAALEGGERGLAFASGLAATTAVLSTLRPGDEVVAAADLYGGTFRLLERVFKPWGLVPRYTEDSSPEGFAAIVAPRTKLVWIETPTNPLLAGARHRRDRRVIAQAFWRARSNTRLHYGLSRICSDRYPVPRRLFAALGE